MCAAVKKIVPIEFPQLGDHRGQLVVLEGLHDIPFEIKRVFYMYGSNADVVRGQHANRETEFVLINVVGTSKVMVDDGKAKQVFVLDRPHIGLYLPAMVWKEMYDFSKDSVLLVLASQNYSSNEYIRDYTAFCKEVNNV